MSVIPPLSDEMQGIVYDTAERYGLLKQAPVLSQTAGPAVYLAPGTQQQSPTGHQFGGLPSVNAGFVWPELLSFVAQINLAELPPGSGLGLPKEGLLQFFFDAEKQEDGSCTGRERRGAVIWQQEPTVTKARPPTDLVRRSQDGLFQPLPFTSFPGLSISPYDGYALNNIPYSEVDIDRHAALTKDLRSMAAPPPSTNRGRMGLVSDEDWLQMGGHIQYFRDGTGYDYRLGAVLEKHGMPRDLVWGKEAVMDQIRNYKEAIPKWCDMLGIQWDVFEKRRASFDEEAQNWVLLLQVPTLNRLGAVWGDDYYVSYIIHERDLRYRRFEQSWVMIHP